MIVNNRLLRKIFPIITFQVTVLLALWWGMVVAVYAESVPGPLVDTQWLASNLDKVVILDVRENEDSFANKAEPPKLPVNPCGVRKATEEKPFIVSGHIPGAVLVPWKEVIEKRKVGAVELKFMLPTKENFEKLMQKSGVSNDSAIVVTSLGMTPGDVMTATRLYWSLKYFGHDNVTLLNGGTAQWVKDGRETEYGKSKSQKGEFKATAERQEMLATAEDVMKVVKGESKEEQLIDVRGQDLYLGLTYPAKSVQAHGQGHIPGAKSFPIYFMTNAASPVASIYNKENILKVANVSGIDVTKPTIAYCNTGAQASVGWFVWHELLGNKNVRLYDGSMHEWSMDANKPVTAMKVE
jgi:thiosulfate/3-mercaptopyruvate sulfurtransferase